MIPLLLAALLSAPRVSLSGEPLCPYEVTLSAGPINRIFDGRQRPRNQTKRGWVVSFDLKRPSELALEYPQAIPDDLEIRPLGRAQTFRIEGNRLAIPVSAPEQFVLTSPSGALEDVHVFVNAPFDASATPREIRFGKGDHHPGVLAPKSGDRIVLEEGARVHAEVFVLNATNVTICGRGLFDFSSWERADPRAREFRRAHALPEEDTEFACNPFVIYGSKNVRVEGVTLKDAPFWTLIVRNGSTDVELDNIKIVGNWRYNSDGINVQASSRVRVHDSFVRSFDDCLVARAAYMKGDDGLPTRDVLFERNRLWCDWGKNCEVWAGHKPTLMENIFFRTNSFLNVHFVGCDVTTWFCSSSTVIRNVVFDGNEFDFAPPRWKTVFQSKEDEPFNCAREEEAKLLSVDAWKPAKNLGNQHFGPAEDESKYPLLYDGIHFMNPRVLGSAYRTLAISSETSTPYQTITNLTVRGLVNQVARPSL